MHKKIIIKEVIKISQAVLNLHKKSNFLEIRVRFFGKIESGFLNPKTDFAFLYQDQ